MILNSKFSKKIKASLFSALLILSSISMIVILAIPASACLYTLTVNIDGDGSVTKNPNQTQYTYGTSVVLTANPDAGWSFSYWTGDLSGSDNPKTIIMNGNKVVTAHFTMCEYTLTVNIDGDGSVTRDPDQLTYTYGSLVELTAVADVGWIFDHWSGDLSGNDNPETIVTDDDKVVTAHFLMCQYTLIVNIDGSGTVTKNPDQPTYTYDTSVELTAIPDLGWSFDHFSDDLSSTNNPDVIVMNNNKIVTAHFTQNQYVLNIGVTGNGIVFKDPDQSYYTYGNIVNLTANADSGWIFDHWTEDLSGNINPTSIIIDSNKYVTAVFIESLYTLTVNIDGAGTVDNIPFGPYNFGDVVNLTANADPGWIFDHWSGDLTGNTNPTTITINSDKIVTAYFTMCEYTLTVNIDGDGSVNKDPDQLTYTYGSLVELTAVADVGWSFNHWSGDLSGNDNPETIVIDGDKVVTAHFIMCQYTLIVNIDGSGTVTKNPNQPTYTYETSVELTAIADLGWSFDHWSGDLSGSDNPKTIVTDDDKVVTAHFLMCQYTLTVNIDGDGTVDTIPFGPYNFGDIINLTALPEIGSTFNCWTGDITGSDNPIDIVMDSNKIVTAHFIQNVYILTINIIGDGSVLKNPALDNYTYGTLVELTAIAGAGSIFDHWSGNLSGNTNPATINMTEDADITAHFILESINNGGGGGGSGGGSSGFGIINKPPVADLSAGEPYTGFLGEEIEFNGSLSYDSDGIIIAWSWDFGDGTTGNGEIVKHSYSSAGQYKVILKVTDNKDAYDFDETTAVVIQPNRPPSKPNITGPSHGLVNIEYNFSVVSTDEDNDKIKYTIDWGDNTYSESDFLSSGILFEAKHKWSQIGNYTIKVVADDNKTISTNDITITIDEPNIPVIPVQNNICLIFLALLGILLMILFLLLTKDRKDKDEENRDNK